MSDFTFYSKTSPQGFKSPALTNALRNFGQLPEQLGKVGSLLTKGIKRNLSGRVLQKRSGRLYESWGWAVNAKLQGWNLIIGSDVEYARIHEFGGLTGRNKSTRIKKSRYVSRVLRDRQSQISKLFRDYLAKIALG